MISSIWKFGLDVPEINSLRSACGFSPLDADAKSMHLLLFDQDIPIACGSLYFDRGEYRICSVCVIKEKRNGHIGDLLIRMLLIKAFNMLAEKVVITPTKDTVAFFEKYGFKATDDKNLTMEVTPQSLILDSKCGHNCKECLNPCK